MSLLLVRHARAGRREAWDGDDRLRPLTAKGQHQAQALIGGLWEVIGDARGPVRMVSSPWLRCRQTLTPLAAFAGAQITSCDDLGEGRGAAAVKLLDSMVGDTVVLCTHGDVVGEVLESVRRQGVDLGRHPRWPKASTWLLQTRSGAIRSARDLAPPA